MSPRDHHGFETDLTLSSRPESVVVARHAMDGIAEGVGLSDATLADARLALTEVCSSIVGSAPEGSRFHISVRAVDDRLRVCVRDGAAGVGVHFAAGRVLPLVAKLADATEVRRGTGSVELRMTFGVDRVSSSDVHERERAQVRPLAG